MKPIPLPIAELKAALAGLSKVINPKASLPVLHHLKVERTADGWIALTGTDLDRFVTMRLEHPTAGPPATILLPYDQLAQVVKNCGRGETIEVESSPDASIIRFPLGNEFGESKLAFVAPEEFPVTPRLQADAIPLPAGVRESILEAMDCASIDSSRYVLNGTFIDISNPKANYIIGTDGKHLYSANSFSLPLKRSLIIPNHKFLGWKEFNADGEWQLKANDKHVQLSSRRWRFITKQIEGNYPDWRVTVPHPSAVKTHITIAPAKLETLIRLIQRMPCHDERLFCIGLEWKQGQFLLLGKDSYAEPWLRVPVPDVQAAGPEITIFVNRKLLIKALHYGLNTISLMEQDAPLRFHSQGRQMIVMPLRAVASPPQMEAKPAPAPVRLPSSRPPPPTPTQASKPMITTPNSEGPTSNDSKSALEEAIDLTLQIRDKFTDGFNLLRDLSLKLKSIHREHKTSSKEFNSVRTTLRTLQSLKL
ncbi:DNA polymerase III subunit beta [Prosthecobacter sp.]|uniref:DNA polymerase III subunit beta n=1 Tax=Prosthecobacter sp. TaxID=1965333 RepID=UPI002AB84794|nr:DNA polymerase III subunit beta [Prosthecobacter sp.]MDZ4405939.1 DNA polymerase III subunit beta [Prosthecobacter sp.]